MEKAICSRFQPDNLSDRLPAETEQPGSGGRSRAKTLLVSVLAAVALVIGLMAGAPAASANQQSDYSKTFYLGASPGSQGQPVTVGWTQDHAWVIASYAAVITAGAGEIASVACNQEEAGLGSACSMAVEAAVSVLTDGQPSLTDHGVWVAYYVWPYHADSGSW